MSYNSPIEIAQKMQEQYEMDVVNNVLKCVRSYGIDVDRDELIKALKYDRQQYEKGYNDGVKEFAEWYKAHLNDLVKYEKDLYADAKTNQHEDNATFFAGEINMLERLLGWIDKKPATFIKETKGEEICEQNTIVDKNGNKYCDTEHCPFAKPDLDLNFHTTGGYHCTGGYPYLKKKRLEELGGKV